MKDVIKRVCIAVLIVGVMAIAWYAVMLPVMLLKWLVSTVAAVVLKM